MKRFVETADWRDPWYRKLSPQAKHLKRYLWDNCDCAGVISVDLEAITFHVGQSINEKHLTELGNWLHVLPNGKHLIPCFIDFQCGEPTATCAAHKPVLKAISSHGLSRSGTLYHHPSNSLSDTLPSREQETEKEKEGEKEQEGGAQRGVSRIAGSTVIPTPLVESPEFLAVWVKWLDHLKQKKKPPTLHAQDLQLLGLSKIGVLRAIETVNFSISKNWQGLYEPNERTTIGQSNHSQGNRPLTGAEQRQVGIPPVPGLGAAEILRNRERQKRELESAKNGMAASPVQSELGSTGSADNG